MAQIISDDAYKMTLELKGHSFKVDVRTYGKKLTLGQMARVEQLFGVETAELQELDGAFSANKVMAWIFGMSLPKIPNLTKEDVEALDYELVVAWFNEIGEKIAAAAAAGDDAPEDDDDPLEVGDPGTTPPSPGEPGWESTPSPSDPEISGT